jgi:hypothetical protein
VLTWPFLNEEAVIDTTAANSNKQMVLLTGNAMEKYFLIITIVDVL